MAKIVIRLACLGVFALLLSIPAMAQNTKGDKPTSPRETRFKKTKKEKPARRISSKRRTTTSLRAYRPRKKSRGGERAGQALGNVYRSRPGREGRQNTFSQKSIYVNNRSASGRTSEARNSRGAPARVVPRSATGSTRNVFRQSGPFVNHSSVSDRKPPRKKRTVTPRSASRSYISRRSINVWANFSRPKQRKERAYSGDITGRRIRTRNYETKRPRAVIPAPPIRTKSRSSETRPQRSTRYMSGNATMPRMSQRSVSNKSTLSRLKRLQSRRAPEGGRKVSVVPRSASSPFIRRKSTNVWAHFPRPKRRSERAVTTDIAGKPLRTRNYRSPRQGFTPSAPRPARQVGDRPYKGPASGSYRSATRTGRSWRGDISGRRLIDRNSSSDRGFRGKAKPGGFRTATTPGETRPGRSPIPVRTPKSGLGIGKYRGNIRSGKTFSDQGVNYSGFLKARKRAKGGGSVSGRAWNNNGTPLPARTPGMGATGIGKYQGNIRGGKVFSDQGEEFRGSMRARRPAKGGGSVSGRLWNNNNQPTPVRTPGIGSKGIGYRGRMRGGKVFSDQGEEFAGNIKARRPAKGGGSVSGKLWNNKETPIPVKSPSKAAMKAGGFPGKLIQGQSKPSFRNQGEEYTGNIKAKKPAKGGGSISGKLWNNNERPIEVRAPKSEQGGEFAGNIKLRKGYVKNPNSAEEALRKKRDKTTYLTDGLHVRVQQHPYGKKPHAADGSMPGWKPSQAQARASDAVRGARSYKYIRNGSSSADALKVREPGSSFSKATDFHRVIRSYKYVRNGSSSEDALKVREPGKAFARATDYQGNVKMKKYEIFGRRGLHPDAQFVKTNKNNVAGEKDVLTNFKLWWARLFKKNETQPDHLKDKGHKPRYDKGEQGLWYD